MLSSFAIIYFVNVFRVSAFKELCARHRIVYIYICPRVVRVVVSIFNITLIRLLK